MQEIHLNASQCLVCGTYIPYEARGSSSSTILSPLPIASHDHPGVTEKLSLCPRPSRTELSCLEPVAPALRSCQRRVNTDPLSPAAN